MRKNPGALSKIKLLMFALLSPKETTSLLLSNHSLWKEYNQLFRNCWLLFLHGHRFSELQNIIVDSNNNKHLWSQGINEVLVKAQILWSFPQFHRFT